MFGSSDSVASFLGLSRKEAIQMPPETRVQNRFRVTSSTHTAGETWITHYRLGKSANGTLGNIESILGCVGNVFCIKYNGTQMGTHHMADVTATCGPGISRGS